MDHKIVVLVLALALLGSAQSALGSCVQCHTCVAGQCTKCNQNFYLNGGNCVACTPCGAGQWRARGCSQTANGDSVCQSCSSVAPCAAGNYFVPSACGTPYTWDNGCRECQNCVDSAGPRTKSWGVCGGPAPYTYKPEGSCMNPGPALCEVCSDYVPEWTFTNFEDPDNITLCPNTRNTEWLFLSGKLEGHLTDCCHAAKLLEEEGQCDFQDEVPFPFAATKSCLYNAVMACMGIYDSLQGGWPLPRAYPPDPMPY